MFSPRGGDLIMGYPLGRRLDFGFSYTGGGLIMCSLLGEKGSHLGVET